MDRYLIDPDVTYKFCLQRMDEWACKTLYIAKDHKLLGVISEGDIRRIILKGTPLSKSISEGFNKKPISVKQEIYQVEQVKHLMIEKRIESIPIVDNNLKVIDILFWNEVFGENKMEYPELKTPVVIMAGGRGTRMQPFTNVFPKPLIPVGDKTMIEIIMDEFIKYGINEFFIALNYKKELIKAYFSDQRQYNIVYVEENQYLGTAGALKLLPRTFNSFFFVVNCDILIKYDYSKIVAFHVKGEYDLTLVASMRYFQVPYGVCEINNVGDLKSISEKPQYDLLVNTGLYILNPTIIEYIPDNTLFHITNLIEILIENGRKIGVFPVSEKSWIDIGQWSEYNENLKAFS